VTAIVGQLAGAHYGASGLPPAWRGSLARSAEIEAMADALHDAAPGNAGG
jgi:ADP-ribosyl-[dinitrogen reductase] hydrolase